MIKKDAVATVHAVGFAIVQRQVEAGHFADAIRAAGMKGSRLLLRRLTHFPEHFARPGEIEFAFGLQVSQRFEQVMRTVYIDVHRGEAVTETLGDKALRGQMVALLEFLTAY